METFSVIVKCCPSESKLPQVLIQQSFFLESLKNIQLCYGRPKKKKNNEENIEIQNQISEIWVCQQIQSSKMLNFISGVWSHA